MTSTDKYHVETLSKQHIRVDFDCGEDTLNEYLIRYALQNQREDNSRTFVATKDSTTVAGFYSLTNGQTLHQDATEAVKKRQPQYPIPVLVIARLAVDGQHKGLGLGFSLLMDCLRRCSHISDNTGVRAVMVEALNDDARNFYLKFGFESSPTNQNRLFLTLKTIRQALKKVN